MNLLESLRISWRSIRGHKLRSTLTTLGVIIGVAAVITFVTLGTGLEAGIIGDISPDDQRNVYTWAASPENSGQGPLAGAQPVFTQRDASEVANLSGVEDAYVYTQVPGQSVTYGNKTVARQGGFIATGAGYLDDDEIAEGRRFSGGSTSLENGSIEAVLNPAMAGLFDRNVSVGDTLTIGAFQGLQVDVAVVGILENSDSRSAFEGFGPSPRLYIPADFQLIANAGEQPRYIALIAEAPTRSDADIEQVKTVTREYLTGPESDAGERATNQDLEFDLQTSTELIGQLEDVLNLLQNFIVGIAGISLLVGSIGIANIMLVSVTERTREIGIMKAVGAQRRDILGLFIVEAIILGVLGAILGTALGLLAGYVVAGYIGIPWVFPVRWTAIAIVVGIAVGVLAGLYPAWSASRTDPIDALRYE
ncbi:ABC-type antimicrobial peptide transport system,permease component [Halapricum desulfuricans]|uniref:ABC-type antimicrobial peptide transport system,permease component n=1 Tax=Halapricum desulfuricans TaxID=2841257 RepID=A0A897NMJ4_9EURY|nr:ABC transporter permease [Halapricum desulfuricans]QSG12113.1 ABC-type antimicrobial peptide transport system,permease component [Halapricum desulfuricans]